MAAPGRRYSEFVGPLHDTAASQDDQTITKVKWEGRRLILAHGRSQEQTALRATRIAALQALALHPAGKLDGQDAGEVHRGRKLSDSGARADFLHEVVQAHLSKIVKVDPRSSCGCAR